MDNGIGCFYLKNNITNAVHYTVFKSFSFRVQAGGNRVFAFVIHRNYQLFYFRLYQRSFKPNGQASEWRGNHSFCNWIPGAGNYIDDAGA